MTTRPTVINPATSIRDAAQIMTAAISGICPSAAIPAWSESSTSLTFAAR